MTEPYIICKLNVGAAMIVFKQNTVKSKQLQTLLGPTIIQSLFNLDDFGLKT